MSENMLRTSCTCSPQVGGEVAVFTGARQSVPQNSICSTRGGLPEQQPPTPAVTGSWEYKRGEAPSWVGRELTQLKSHLNTNPKLLAYFILVHVIVNIMPISERKFLSKRINKQKAPNKIFKKINCEILLDNCITVQQLTSHLEFCNPAKAIRKAISQKEWAYL